MFKKKPIEEPIAKIGTADEALWNGVLFTAEQEIKHSERAIKINSALVELAKQKIEIEKGK